MSEATPTQKQRARSTATRDARRRISAIKRRRVKAEAATADDTVSPVPLARVADAMDSLGMLPGQQPDRVAQGATLHQARREATEEGRDGSRLDLHDLVMERAREPGEHPDAGAEVSRTRARAPAVTRRAEAVAQVLAGRRAPREQVRPAAASAADGGGTKWAMMHTFEEFLQRYRTVTPAKAPTPRLATQAAPPPGPPEGADAAPARDAFLDALLARRPHWDALADLAHDPEQAAQLVALQPIGAARVAEALYEPEEGQRPCVLGQACQGTLLAHSRAPLVLREWMTTEELSVWRDRGTLPALHGPCLLCVHFLVNRAWHRARNRDQGGGVATALLQPHYYVVDQPGEYRAGVMIQSTGAHGEGLARPFRLHCLSDYCEDLERGELPTSTRPQGFRERAEVFFH